MWGWGLTLHTIPVHDIRNLPLVSDRLDQQSFNITSTLDIRPIFTRLGWSWLASYEDYLYMNLSESTKERMFHRLAWQFNATDDMLQELGGARGLCVHPVIIVRLAPQISGLAEEGHAPLVRALKEQGPPHVLRHVRLPRRPALIPGGRPPPRSIHHLSIKTIRPPVVANIFKKDNKF